MPLNRTESKIKTQVQTAFCATGGGSLIGVIQYKPFASLLSIRRAVSRFVGACVCMVTCATYIKGFSKRLPREPTISPSVQNAWPRKSCVKNIQVNPWNRNKKKSLKSRAISCREKHSSRCSGYFCIWHIKFQKFSKRTMLHSAIAKTV